MISHIIIQHLSQIHEEIYFMPNLYRCIPNEQKGQWNNEIQIITKIVFPCDLVGPVSIRLPMRILFLWRAQNCMFQFWATAISLNIQSRTTRRLIYAHCQIKYFISWHMMRYVLFTAFIWEERRYQTEPMMFW